MRQMDSGLESNNQESVNRAIQGLFELWPQIAAELGQGGQKAPGENSGGVGKG